MSTGATVTELHKRHHDDYDQAQREIHQSLGDFSDFECFGHQVLVAVYVRPAFTQLPDGRRFYTTTKQQAEDVYQGKAVMVLKLGPAAFDGDDSYVQATFGPKGAPKVGDWVFVRPQDGVAINLCGDGAERPKGTDHQSNAIDLYEWEGWPCRLITDEAFLGRVKVPHHIV